MQTEFLGVFVLDLFNVFKECNELTEFLGMYLPKHASCSSIGVFKMEFADCIEDILDELLFRIRKSLNFLANVLAISFTPLGVLGEAMTLLATFALAEPKNPSLTAGSILNNLIEVYAQGLMLVRALST